MNVVLYVGLVTLAGLVASHRIGRLASGLGAGGATLVFLIASVALGIVLAVPLLMVVGSICGLLGFTDTQCIPTNDQTVWFLAVPLAACPGYTISMFAGRAASRRKQMAAEQAAA